MWKKLLTKCTYCKHCGQKFVTIEIIEYYLFTQRGIFRIKATNAIVLQTFLSSFENNFVSSQLSKLQRFVFHPRWMHSEGVYDLLVNGQDFARAWLYSIQLGEATSWLEPCLSFVIIPAGLWVYNRIRVYGECCNRKWEWGYFDFPLSRYEAVLVVQYFLSCRHSRSIDSRSLISSLTSLQRALLWVA